MNPQAQTSAIETTGAINTLGADSTQINSLKITQRKRNTALANGAGVFASKPQGIGGVYDGMSATDGLRYAGKTINSAIETTQKISTEALAIIAVGAYFFLKK